MTTSEAKRLLRNEVRRLKREYSSAVLQEHSQCILERLLSHPRVTDASVVLAYHSLTDEVDTRDLLDRLLSKGKTVLLPQVTGSSTMVLRQYEGPESLVEGAFGIMEPIGKLFTDYEKVELAIVPGMAFDRAGHRLGRGKGYYDRLLPQLTNAFKIGICFDFQFRSYIPHEEHDEVMNEVIPSEI